MNWFEDQVNARRRSDREALNNAYKSALDSVLGESFSFDDAQDELSAILGFYRMPAVRIPDGITDENEKLSTMCRISGLMQRPVTLEEDWYKVAFGAYLCRKKKGGEFVAVLPGKLGGYSFYDKETHKHIRLNGRTCKLLENESVCFYKPLPAGKLSILDVAAFGVSAWSAADYIMTFVMLGISTLVGLLVPKINYFLYSTVIEEGSVSLLMSTMLFLMNVGLATVFLNAMKDMFSSRNNVKMDAALQSATMMRILSLPVSFFREYSSGEIMSRMNYLGSLSSEIVDMVFSTTLSSLFSLAYLSQIFNYAASLVVPSLCVILAKVLFALYSSIRQMGISKRQMELGAENNGKAIAMVSGIQKIKMSGSEKRVFARYVRSFAEESRVRFNPPFFNKYSTVISAAISYVGIMLMYYFTVESGTGVAEYYAFQSAYAVISAAITSLVGISIRVSQMKPSLEMVKPILDAVPENVTAADEVTSLKGSIELNNVTFRYDDKSPNVIDDMSLKINPGQYVAIVGRTGCGKSTLVRLLLGFEKPQSGSICYDGKDLNLLDKRSLRRKIGTVMQDDRLFNGDIYSNIVICAPTLSVTAAWEAAEIAGIADDIKAMPMGMFTIVSEGGGGISGGQRQRIAIARAIAPKPGVLIFDEATSALDNITQKKVSDALENLHCTRIVIAHRLSTIRHCDRIYVMDKGHITESGTYDELLTKNGYFAELVERQRLDK